MIRVGLCNTDMELSAEIEAMLSDILSSYDTFMVVSYDRESLIKDIRLKTFDCRLLFLDITNKDEGLADLEEYLAYGDCKTDVIYVTGDRKYVMGCYEGCGGLYVLKPMHSSDMKREISRYFKENNISPRCIRVTFGAKESYIPIDSIMYVESKHRKLFIYTKDMTYEYYCRLDDLEKELSGEPFIRCHQSYLVAIAYITNYENDDVYIDEKPIPVSRRYRHMVQSVIYQAELFGEASSHVFVKDNIHSISKAKGSLICIKGEYMGKVVRLVSEATVVVGRSADTADIVVNLPRVSRRHCLITYHEDGDYYEVQDCSTNGTFVDGEHCLRRGDVYGIKPGTSIVFGDDSLIFRFG